MKRALCLLLTSAALAIPMSANAFADSIGEVEGARADERAGRGLNRQQVEKLRRYGGNDDGYYNSYGNGYYSDGYAGPSVGVYVGPGGPGYYGYSGRPYGY